MQSRSMIRIRRKLGFADNLMPEDYGQKLTEEQLGDLVAFLKPQS